MRILTAFLFVALSAAADGAVKHTIVNLGNTFSPPTLTIALGDTVEFDIAGIHNAVEVSQTTWNANGDTPLGGGFALPNGGGTVVLTSLGTHWYVCQPHSSIAMKGTITVDPVAPPVFSSIAILSTADRDGNDGSTSDRVDKKWSLKLYAGSIAPANLIDSVDSETTLFVDSLDPGTYVAVEADSAYWTHISQIVNGTPQGPTSQNFRNITLGADELQTVEFLNTAPNLVINDGFVFVPETIVVDSSDTVRFVLELMHNARQVDSTTWEAEDTTGNGGFDLPLGGGDVIMNTVGTAWYVCVPHINTSMKGRITVKPVGAFTGPIADDWNLLSLPLEVEDNTVAGVYPTAVSPAYTYANGYVSQSSVSTGQGYWLKFVGVQDVNIDGTPVTLDTVPVQTGWNIIGGITTPVAVAAITSIPGGIVTSSFFRYEAGYFSSDTLQPGLGYWVKTTSSGSLVIDAGARIEAAAAIRIVPTPELPPPPPTGTAGGVGSGHDGVHEGGTPKRMPLISNYPNPFNPSTLIRYTVPQSSFVRISVHSTIGESVAIVRNEHMEAGEYTMMFDASRLPAGVYYARIAAGGWSAWTKMVLVR